MAMDEEAAHACLAYSMAELLRTGTTTVMEIGAYGEEAVRQAGRVGMRLYMGLGYRSGRWYTDDGKEVKYAWDEEAGLRGMERAVRFIEEHDGAQNGRIKGFLSPSQVDTCTEDLLRRSRQAATSMRVPLALHTSQSVNEFLEMTRRHGATPIEWLRDIGFLGPDVILGHAIIVAPGSWTNWAGDDIGILAETGTNVAHCRLGLRPARHRHGELRPLPGARGQHDPRHRHQPAEHDRRRCATPRSSARSSTGKPRSPPPPTSSTPRPWAGRKRSAATISVASRPAPRPISCSGGATPSS